MPPSYVLVKDNELVKDGSPDGRIAFDVDGTTLTVRDVIEGEKMRLGVDREPDLSPALPALFPSPVDDAVSFEAQSLTVPEYTSIVVRDDEGKFIGRPNEPTEFPRGSYCIDITGVTKASLRFEDAELSVSGVEGSDPVEIALGRPATVSLGARSLHTRPEATVTVPDDPEALAEAVSVLGSSIREFSAERSWPTLRGYPPRIRRGESLDSPLTVPDTGVEVVVRPTYADVYRLSTLAYYLGAQMTVGEKPAVRLDNGYTEQLPTDGRQLEERAEALLRTWFFLDTLVRTDGYTLSDREEYEQVGPQLPFYPPNLDELSLRERLMEYLEVDPATVEPHAPEWSTEAVLRPGPAGAELLPHLAHVLAPVRVRGSVERTRPGDSVGLTTADRPTDGPQSPTHDDDPISDPDRIRTRYRRGPPRRSRRRTNTNSSEPLRIPGKRTSRSSSGPPSGRGVSARRSRTRRWPPASDRFPSSKRRPRIPLRRYSRTRRSTCCTVTSPSTGAPRSWTPVGSSSSTARQRTVGRHPPLASSRGADASRSEPTRSDAAARGPR